MNTQNLFPKKNRSSKHGKFPSQENFPATRSYLWKRSLLTTSKQHRLNNNFLLLFLSLFPFHYAQASVCRFLTFIGWRGRVFVCIVMSYVLTWARRSTISLSSPSWIALESARSATCPSASQRSCRGATSQAIASPRLQATSARRRWWRTRSEFAWGRAQRGWSIRAPTLDPSQKEKKKVGQNKNRHSLFRFDVEPWVATRCVVALYGRSEWKHAWNPCWVNSVHKSSPFTFNGNRKQKKKGMKRKK